MNEYEQGRFATTQWSLVNAAGHVISEVARAAMEKHVRSIGFRLCHIPSGKDHSAAIAEDLTQAFFVHLLESEFMSLLIAIGVDFGHTY